MHFSYRRPLSKAADTSVYQASTIPPSTTIDWPVPPGYHDRVTCLRIIQTRAPLARGRKPAAFVVLLEYLGGRPDLLRGPRVVRAFRGIRPGGRPDDPIADRQSDTAGTFMLEAGEV
ncbi:hypothetical protein [Inquilinus limosus]|uniref:hypothetical protein n=1 Tax=Inquilinus limosus TaxID=171674 RepID=UPI0012DE3C43|nr:hypothetical protein [Inquilinus limosus]